MSLHRTLIATSIAACLLAACDRNATEPTVNAAAPAPAPTSIDDFELIPRDALFGNPERASVQISPDGKYLSWLAAVDGVINVWIAPAGDTTKARAVTAERRAASASISGAIIRTRCCTCATPAATRTSTCSR